MNPTSPAEYELQPNSQSSSSSHSNNKWGLGYRKYSRITPEMKDKLIFLIVRSNMSIKQAAQYLKINYSSAKFIFSQYRDRNFQSDQPTSMVAHVCLLRKMEPGESDQIELKYTVGGKYEGETSKLVDAYEIYSKNN